MKQEIIHVKAPTLACAFDAKSNNFDIIRLVAALVVAFAHSYALARNESDPLTSFLSYGFSGTLAVWVFLVVSGFLIARSAESHRLSTFILSRFLRIYPGLFLIIMVESFIIAPAVFNGSTSEYWHVYMPFHLRNLMVWPQNPWLPNIFAGNPNQTINGSLWTIPLEMSFYILLVFLSYFVMAQKRIYLIVFVISIISALYLDYSGFGPGILTKKYLVSGIDAYYFVIYAQFFVAGVCAWKYRGIIPISATHAVVALIALFAARNSISANLVIVPCLTYLVLYCGVVSGHGSRIQRRIGDLSYGCYIFAYPLTNCIVYATSRRLTSIEVFFVLLLFLIPLSWCSWEFLEKRCLSLKRRN